MTKINGYTLVDPPYQGGMAVVYKGQKGAFARAFKMVRPDKASNNPRLCQQFLKEIKLHVNLDHPHIIKILDAYPYTDSHGITSTVLEMEWLNGMDLQRYVEKYAPKGLSADTVKRIAKQVIDGLEYAHNKHILHLDIKPSNLFRTADGYIKILDFGIARVVGENAEIVEGASNVTVTTTSGESTFKGTLAYASPEQWLGATVNYTSDIFSLGRTIQFLATGSTDPGADIPDPVLNAVVEKCTVNKPQMRYQNCAELRAAFENPAPRKACPKCRQSVPDGTKFCPNCGARIEPEPVPTKVLCPKCGNMCVPQARYCDKCGHDLKPAPIPNRLNDYKCSKCGKTTKAYSDGKVFFCNFCGANNDYLQPVYQQ